MRIGAHCSSAGGPHHALEKAREIGAEAVQIFISAPQQWKPPAITPEQSELFRAARAESGAPVFMHAVYLVNLASDDTTLANRSAGSRKQYLKWGAELGTMGTIFHAGSHKGVGFEAVVKQVCRLMREALEFADNDQLLILENNAGQGNCLPRSFADIGAIIRELDDDPRVGVCIDTCHAFAMGYDLATTEGCELAMSEFEREAGKGRLVAVHANDSKMPLGGTRDRHENIGDGHIGYDGFRTIMSHRAFRDVPFLLEVPGIDGRGPDAENVARLKRLRAEVGAPGG